MANTEQIEAKLCAYVDGELDAAGRAEIEAHLAANPQHRELLKELMAQRELLRELPRERAPEDMVDSVQTQLERSVLLNLDTPPATAGRINPWPQVFALAAVLILAVGLAAVIYLVLPDQSKQVHNYAVIPATTAPADGAVDRSATSAISATEARRIGAATAPALAVAPVATPVASPAATPLIAGGERAMAKGESSALADEYKKSEAAGAPASAAPASPSATLDLSEKHYAGKRAADIFANDAVVNATTNPTDLSRTRQIQIANGMFEALPLDAATFQCVTQSTKVPDNAYVMVVASADPTATDRQVTGYLAQNNIRWDDVTEPMPVAINTQKEEAYPSKMQTPQIEMRGKLAAPTPGPLMKQNRAEADKAKSDAPTAVATDIAANAPPSEPTTQAQQQLEQQFKDSKAAPATVPARDAGALAIATTQPSQSLDRAAQQSAQIRLDSLTLQSQQPSQQQQLASPSRLIVARNLTQDQVAQLNGSMYANNARVGNFFRNGSSVTPTTMPVALASSQSAAGTVDLQKNLNGGGGSGGISANDKDAMARMPGAAAATQPTTQISIGGTVVGASGSTTQPTTAAAAPTVQVTTQSIGQLAGMPVTSSATQPTTQSLALVPTTAQAADRVDVVIVVKSDPFDANGASQQFQINPATAMPATVPATAPATTQPATTHP